MMHGWIDRFAIDDNGFCWFLDSLSRSIYRMHIDSGETEFWGFSGDKCSGLHLFQDIVVWNQKALLIPHEYHSFQILALNNGEILTEIPCYDIDKEDYTSDLRFVTGVYQESVVYVIPYNYPVMTKIDLSTGLCEYFDFCMEDVETLHQTEDLCKMGRFHNAKIIGNKIYAPLRFTNVFLIIDTDLRKYNIIRVGKRGNRFVDICYDGENFWLTSDEGDIFVWNGKSETIEVVFSYSKCGFKPCVVHGNCPYPYIFEYGNNLIVFDDCYPVVKINRVTGNAIIANDLGEFAHYACFCAREKAEKLYSYFPYQCKFAIMDKINGNITNIDIKLPTGTGKKILTRFIDEIVS